jgi:hypothetical protein
MKSIASLLTYLMLSFSSNAQSNDTEAHYTI